jgi:hypothetical protein
MKTIIAWMVIVGLGLFFTISIIQGVGGKYNEIEKARDCKQLEFDMKIVTACEQASNCTFSYTEMHELVDRMVDCVKK